MRQEERLALRRRFKFRCAYCGVRERDVGAELTVDHFQPSSKGGPHESENWVYCCHACNQFKGDYWQPESPLRILNPLHDAFALHIAEEADSRLRGITETGQFHIERLSLNRQPLVELRRDRRRQKTAKLEKARRLQRIQELEELVRELSEELRNPELEEPDS